MKKKRKWPKVLLILLVIFILFCLFSDDKEYVETDKQDSYYSDSGNDSYYCEDGYCYRDYEDEYEYGDCEDGYYYNDYEDGYEYSDCEDGYCYRDDEGNNNNYSKSDWNDKEDDSSFWGEEVFEDYPHGSCNTLSGKTLVLSIFVGNSEMGWSDSDSQLKKDSLKDLQIATGWLSENAAKFGSNAEFIYDWSKNEDLYFETTLNCDLLDLDYGGVDEAAWDYIDKKIDVDGLKSKYSADNILFMYIINPPKSNRDTSATRVYTEGMYSPYECCYMYMYTENEKESPAGFAHEILHTFGAPDLYMADTDGNNSGITEEYVNMCWSTQCNDIMFTTYGNETGKAYYDRITNDFTELDAYYVGIADHSDVVNKWGFDASEHQR